MQAIEDKSIDMILCDLPYGVTDCRWDSVLPFDQLWKQYERIIKDNGAIVLTAIQPFTTVLIQSNRKLFTLLLVTGTKTARPVLPIAKKQAYALLDALGCKYREHQAGLFVWAELPESYEGDSFAFSDEVMDKCDVFLTRAASSARRATVTSASPSAAPRNC